jgi:hypothetical protein
MPDLIVRTTPKKEEVKQLTQMSAQQKNETGGSGRQSLISSLVSSHQEVSSRKSVIGESVANVLHDKLYKKK